MADDLRRFIPTRAGNTLCLGYDFRLMTVHPHSRGEHERGVIEPEQYLGSSPLARGTLVEQAHQLAILRFIPTRAGNTQHAGRSHNPAGGSSPLARGTRVARSAYQGGARFIPTRAGNTGGVGRS
ncbi:conserved hypothetical protein [Nitrospira defluvii]|uniref:Uncharacterized protein n=1 Tax=Nitrospira defluvii TaxID=330214 RepID=A0ABM8S3Z9_9BACT|nr:conserved hypothetical protein [Nitrospira defluvii]